MIKEFKNKKILVTGGTGSIGSAIVKELLKCGPYQIRVFSRDETKQFELMHEIGPSTKVDFLIGDVRDKERLNLAMENIDIVFHAAALKHVVACENNPFEAVKTNVQGTQNVIDCAYANQVDKVIMISTDKATDPTNVMGCTKLLAEKLILASFLYKGKKKTKFCCVRFGNVLGSRGSVVPLFINQIKRGQPITVTDPRMTRFIMSIPQAVQLVFKSAQLMKNHEIFVLKMPVVTLKDLAQAVIEAFREKNKVNRSVPVKIIGKNGGERIHEKLLTVEESAGALELDDMFVILPNLLEPSVGYELLKNNSYPRAKRANVHEYSSMDNKKMTVAEIKKLLLSNHDLKFDL
ncbi:MAG: polysaccharide biosynthesis protein [Patescibacteria group bacterium]|nr:polysaccharide biosynthesis protein [Patescibacteria group bacterium]